jgi:N-acetylglutamate synthase
MDLHLCQQLEESLLTVWPSETTIMLEGWAVRCARGYSGRANSASALTIGATLSDALLDHIENHYQAAGLVPTVRVTPIADAGVELLLLKRGYTLVATSLTLIAKLDQPFPFSENTGLATHPHDVWEHGVCRSQSGHKRHPEKLHAIVGRITVPRRFATLREMVAPSPLACVQ